MTTGKNNHCAATRADGSPCGTPPLPDSVYCFGHDPDRAEERLAARVKGGQNHSNAARALRGMPPHIRDIWDALSEALEGVRSGDMSAAQGRSISDIARAMLQCVEVADFAARIDAMEQAAGKRRTAG